MPSRSRGPRNHAAGGGRRRAVAPADADAGARERILQAALEAFAEHGFEGARTREIAERAGANLGLLSYYFAGKEELWRAAVSRAFEEIQAELAGILTGPAADERERLERVLRGFVRFVARRPEFMRLMNDEGKRDGPRMRWLAERHVKPMAAAVRRLVEGAQARGVLPALSPVSIHYVALGAAGLVFSQAPECAFVHGVDPTREAFAAAHADALVALLLGPRRRPAKKR